MIDLLVDYFIRYSARPNLKYVCYDKTVFGVNDDIESLVQQGKERAKKTKEKYIERAREHLLSSVAFKQEEEDIKRKTKSLVNEYLTNLIVNFDNIGVYGSYGFVKHQKEELRNKFLKTEISLERDLCQMLSEIYEQAQ